MLGWRNLLRQLYAYHELSNWPLPEDEKGVRDALTTVLRRTPGRPIVIAVDTLDEADEIPDLPLPPTLPDGLFVIASVRAADEEQPPQLKPWPVACARMQLEHLTPAAIAGWLRTSGRDELAGTTEDDPIPCG